MGGTQALELVRTQLPADAPGIAITQHIFALGGLHMQLKKNKGLVRGLGLFAVAIAAVSHCQFAQPGWRCGLVFVGSGPGPKHPNEAGAQR